MRAGLLRTPVTFTRRTHGQTSSGAYAAEWEPVLSTRARVDYDKGGVTQMGAEPVPTAAATLTVRHYHRIAAEWRVVLDGREWQQVRPPVTDRDRQCQYVYVAPVNK